MSKQIVIIGGGATAVSAFAHLAGSSGVERVTFVAPGPIGLGTAFGTTDPALLCNTSVDVTALKADGRSDFLDYLASRGHPAHRADFAPRYLVGQYCRERFWQYSDTARRAGTRVTHIRDRAVAIDREPDTDGTVYKVALAGGGSVTGTDILFCAGADNPVLPPELRPYAGHPRLMTTPYPSHKLRRLPADARVLVLGTKLSAIDAAVTLCRTGNRRTVMTSPSGMLPAVRNRLVRPATPRLRQDVWAALAASGTPEGPADEAALDRTVARELLSAIRAGAPGARVDRPRLSGRPAPLLREERHRAAAGRIPWEDVMAELIDTVNAQVSRWRADVRGRVLPRYRALMSRYISAFPLRNATLLDGWLTDGRLRVAPRYPERMEPGEAGWSVRWPDGTTETFDHIVCASGYRVAPLTSTATGVRIGAGEADGTAGDAGPRPEVLEKPEVLENLRIRLSPDGPAERIWALGAGAGSRFPIVNYLRAAAQHAAVVADQLGQYSPGTTEPLAERTAL